MKRICQLLFSAIACTAVSWLLYPTTVSAQEFTGFVERTADKWSQNPVISDSSLALLASFAQQWNELSVSVHGEDELQVVIDLSVFPKTRPSTVQELLNKFATQSDTLTLFDDTSSQQQFNRIYARAVESGSPIGKMTPDAVLEYWAATKVIADREAIENALQLDPSDSHYLCIWILYPCKPKPPPEEGDQALTIMANTAERAERREGEPTCPKGRSD